MLCSKSNIIRSESYEDHVKQAMKLAGHKPYNHWSGALFAWGWHCQICNSCLNDAVGTCRHHDALWYQPMLDVEVEALASCLDKTEAEVHDISAKLIQLENAIMESLYPGTAAKLQELEGSPPLCTIASLSRLAVRDFPLRLHADTVHFAPRIAREAPGLQEMPEWEEYSRLVVWAADKVCICMCMPPVSCYCHLCLFTSVPKLPHAVCR